MPLIPSRLTMTDYRLGWGLGQEIGIGVIMSMLKREDEVRLVTHTTTLYFWHVPD